MARARSRGSVRPRKTKTTDVAAHRQISPNPWAAVMRKMDGHAVRQQVTQFRPNPFVVKEPQLESGHLNAVRRNQRNVEGMMTSWWLMMTALAPNVRPFPLPNLVTLQGSLQLPTV